MALTIKVAESKPRVFLVSLAGKLDSGTYAEAEKKIDYLIADGQAKVITLDLAGLEFISSMGVRVVFKAKKGLSATGGQLLMVNVPPPVQKVFEIIDALPSMKIFSGIAELDAYLAKMQQG
jgi:anti-anti-sigma factor